MIGLFRPIRSATGRAVGVLAALAIITFGAPFLPDATWWLS